MKAVFIMLFVACLADFLQLSATSTSWRDVLDLRYLRGLAARGHGKDTRAREVASEVQLRSEEGCANPADIAFVLDESGSIYGPDFDKQLQFVNDVIDAFTIGPEDTHIAALTFATDTKIVMTLLQDLTDVDAMKNKVSATPQRRGNTRTDLALRVMRTTLFSSHYARAEVVHIGIVITDGGSDDADLTAQQADLVRQDGIIMFAIGVGRNVVEEELQKIATGPDYVFKVDNYEALEKLKETLARKACHATTLPPQPTTPVATEPPTTEPPTTKPQMKDGCEWSRPMDILFGLPDEAGILDTDHAISFVTDMIDGLTIGGQWVQAGLTPRMCADSKQISFSEHDSKDAIKNAVSGRRLTTTEFSLQLEYLLLRGFTAEDGGRQDVKRVAVLILDNNVEDESRVQSLAMDVRSAGITLIVIGVGERVDRGLLTSIAHTPDYAFFVHSYGELVDIEEDVGAIICRGLGPEPIQSTTVPALPPVIEDCDATSPFDVIFSLPDESGVRGTELSLDFVQMVISRLRIAADGVYAGLTPRRCQDLAGVYLTEYDEKEALLMRIDSRGLEATRLSLQLQYLVDTGFSQADGARSGVPRFAVMVVDNVSADPEGTRSQAASLKAAGVTVITIGVGQYVDSVELSEIATSDSHSFLVYSYSDLGAMSGRLLTLLCQEIS